MKDIFASVLYSLGSPAVWRKATDPSVTAQITVGIKTAGPKDSTVVQAYGINARIITMDVAQFPVPPEKFDTVTVNGEDIVLETVHRIMLNASVSFYRAYARGND